MSTARAAGLLAFVASPSLALMGLVTASDAPHMALCGSGMSSIGGMPAMYLLMSLFHLSPWLRLVSGRRQGAGVQAVGS